MRFVVACALLLAACGGTAASEPTDATTATPTPASTTTGAEGNECAHVRAVTVTADGAGTFTFEVTVASTDTGWEK